MLATDVLAVDADMLADAMRSATPLAFHHDLADDPRLAFDALAAAAAAMPRWWLAPQRACHEFVCGPPVPADAAPPDLVRNLGDNDSSIRLYHLELVAAFRDLGAELVDAVVARVGSIEGGVTDQSESAFLGSPGAITPVHIDRHHNLLLQVSGTKEVFVGTFPDADRAQREIERAFWSCAETPTALPPDVTRHLMGPGDGLYLPPYAFHWTRVGDVPSIAMSAAWSTVATDRTAAVIGVNKSLRRLGVRPRPPGRRVVVDSAKATVAATLSRGRRVAGGARRAATVTPRNARAEGTR